MAKAREIKNLNKPMLDALRKMILRGAVTCDACGQELDLHSSLTISESDGKIIACNYKPLEKKK